MLSVFTLTAGTRPEWLQQCVDSVRSNGFDAMSYSVIECREITQWADHRLQCIALGGEYVAFVDDDDIVMNDSLWQCVQALEHTQAGVAFTIERMVHETGEPADLSGWTPTRLDQVANVPRAIHHLAVMRRSAIDLQQVTAAIADLGLMETGSGVDWALRANAAARAGAVHVPIVGYGWRRHGAQMHRGRQQAESFARAAPTLRSRIRAWFAGKMDEPISHWGPHANRS